MDMFETWRAFINGKKMAEAEVLELKRLLTNAVDELEAKKERIEILELEVKRAREKIEIWKKHQKAKVELELKKTKKSPGRPKRQ